MSDRRNAVHAVSGGGRPAGARPDVLRNLGLFALVCLALLCTLSDADFGWLTDGQIVLDTAVNLREFGGMDIGYGYDQDGSFAPAPGRHGKYGVGFSLVQQIPLLFAPLVETTFGEGQSNVLFPLTNALITALTALLTALSVRALGCGFRTAALAAVGFAFGTFAWPYVSYDFSEPLQALCVAGGFWLLIHGVRSRARTALWMAAAGSALGFAVLTKASLLLLIPGFALYVCVSPGPASERRRRFAWFATTLALWGLLIASLNAYRFGSMFEFGYGEETVSFTSPWSEGLYGLLLSPNKGLIFYAPLVLLVPVSLWLTRRSHRPEALFFVSTFVVYVLTIAKWWSWEGGYSWGPRLLVPILPLATVSAAILMGRARWSVAPFVGCVAAGVAVNLLGVLMNFTVWIGVAGLSGERIAIDLSGRPSREYVVRDGKRWFEAGVATSYVPALSPIRGHFWLLRMRYLGRPFALDVLRGGSFARAPSVKYPPVEIDFSRMMEGYVLSRLRAAHLWIWDRILDLPREPIFRDAVYGWSLQRLGSAAEENGLLDRAVECYSRALTVMPAKPEFALDLSRAQAKRGSLSEAQETLASFVARSPLEEEARIELAGLYEQTDDRAAALREYETYLRLHPDGRHRGFAVRRLRALSRDRKPSPAPGASQR